MGRTMVEARYGVKVLPPTVLSPRRNAVAEKGLRACGKPPPALQNIAADDET
jgi:hypothetical protein